MNGLLKLILKPTHTAAKTDNMLRQLGWHKNANPGYSSMPYHLVDENNTWHAGYRWLKRHRYFGITPDSAIRYRTIEGLRIQLSRPSVKPSRLIITTLATSGWLKWLLKLGLRLRGYKRHQQRIGSNQLFYQDDFLAEQLLQHDNFLIFCKTLSSQTGMLRWELGLLPGKLTLNLTLIDNYDVSNFPKLFSSVKQLAVTVDQIPHSTELSLTAAETQQLSNPEGQLKKSQVIKGGLIVLGVLLLFTATLMGILFGISWLLS